MPTGAAQQQQSAINFRSVLLGLLGTILICGLSPYNDYVLNNTFLVGNNLPLGVIVLLFLFVLLVNTPLRARGSTQALSQSELAVAFGMMLVSCAIPGSGLMRYFPASLIGPWWQARASPEYLTLLQSLDLPDWLFPSFASSSSSTWSNDPVTTDFLARSPTGSIPFLAWLKPAVTWGIFLGALAVAVLSMIVIFHRQWSTNERLPFPLAELPIALIEDPAKGAVFNTTLRSRGFWIALVAIFCLHVWNGLGLYLPRYIPRIPVWYDLSALFTEPPLTYVDQKLKDAAVFFTVVGVSYFLSSSISFSLWAFFLGFQALRMVQGTATGDPTLYGQQDQHIGAILAYLASLLFIARHHLASVARQAFSFSAGEPHSYRLPVWLLVGSIAVMLTWLMLAGCNVVVAAIAVGILLSLFLVISRVIAETGLVQGQLIFPLYKPFQLLASGGFPNAISTRSFYLTSLLQSVHYDMREPLSVYASHALRAKETSSHSSKLRQSGLMMAILLLTLCVGFTTSLTSTLATEYTYASTLDTPTRTPINTWGAETNPRTQILDATIQYDRAYYFPRHSAPLHIGIGFAVTAILAFLRLRFAGFPLHPVGFLMVGTYPGSHLWLSVFIGWCCKTLLVRLGGIRLYSDAKPFFLGLIVGESLAAAFWMLGGVVLTTLNIPYRVVNIMPG